MMNLLPDLQPARGSFLVYARPLYPSPIAGYHRTLHLPHERFTTSSYPGCILRAYDTNGNLPVQKWIAEHPGWQVA
jgi:hypothetical protein